MRIRFYTDKEYEEGQVNKTVPFAIEIKRFHLPVIIEGNCPKCNAIYKYDLYQAGYLSYPLINVPESFTCYCCECNYEWKILLQLNLNLELIKG
jgi:hypothetical protein